MLYGVKTMLYTIYNRMTFFKANVNEFLTLLCSKMAHPL